MPVVPEEAHSKIEHGEYVLYFCSEKCEEEFKKNPDKYIAKIKTEAPMEPMHRHH